MFVSKYCKYFVIASVLIKLKNKQTKQNKTKKSKQTWKEILQSLKFEDTVVIEANPEKKKSIISVMWDHHQIDR